MRVVFWHTGKSRETKLASAIASGAARRGDAVEIRPIEDYAEPVDDGSILCGITKRKLMTDHRERGALLLYVDKGYKRTRDPEAESAGEKISEWWRVVVNDVHPTKYFQATPRPGDRRHAAGLKLKERRPPGDHVMIAGSSAKFHLAMGLPPPEEWASYLIARLKRHTDQPVIYRPKPSYHDAVPVEGAEFDWGQKTVIRDVLTRCSVMVTYGSIAAVDAICSGVPVIVLGNAVARPICSTDLEAVADPRWALGVERKQWANDLAYCQWRAEELASGAAWRVIREQIEQEMSCRTS